MEARDWGRPGGRMSGVCHPLHQSGTNACGRTERPFAAAADTSVKFPQRQFAICQLSRSALNLVRSLAGTRERPQSSALICATVSSKVKFQSGPVVRSQFRHGRLWVGLRQPTTRIQSRKAARQVELPDSRRPRSAVIDPMLSVARSGSGRSHRINRHQAAAGPFVPHRTPHFAGLHGVSAGFPLRGRLRSVTR